ncbi:MAG TPA: Rrf2 family transcriptional regulator [Rubrivivax sp.]|nr:Rrf2 family transcriptional regulator [Burkholderiales bacterium]HNU10775.1 Rrf2 family transcriptional regulator [Rubrivivax sp.]
MRLADYTDYALRVLLYCAQHADRLVTVGEIAERQGLAKNQVMKIVADLAHAGLLETVRGRSGGVRLMRPAAEIRVGDVVRLSETDLRLTECFDHRSNRCTLTAECGLRGVFARALHAFFGVLDSVTLGDLSAPARSRRSGSQGVRDISGTASKPLQRAAVAGPRALTAKATKPEAVAVRRVRPGEPAPA